MIRFLPKKILFSIGFIAFLATEALSQEFIIKGKVAEQGSGMALAGASIVIKGTVRGTVADKDANFTLAANKGDIVVVSFLGYISKEFEVTTNELGTIELSVDSKFLSEVVVTGALGIERSSREIGGGAQVISKESLNQGRTINPIFGLSSKVSGLRINMYDSKVDPEIQITMRGSRSLSRTAGIDGRGSNEPLYVVDGISIPSISRLNPNDIASITVLKGANAAALYGSEGVNGAIMITTKRGSQERGEVRFSHTTTFSDVFMLPPAQTRYGQGTNGAYNATQYESWGPEFDGTLRDFGTPLPNGTQPQLAFAAPTEDARLGLFQTGINTQNDISFSGGNASSTYFVSAQDVSIKGIIPDDESRRTGFRFNGSRKIGKLATSYNFNYVFFKKDITPDGPWIGAYQLPANFPYAQMENWRDPLSIGNPLNYFSPTGTSNLKNPFFQIGNIRNKTEQQTINGKIELEYAVTPWLKAMNRLGLYSLIEETRNTTGKFEAAGTRNVNGSVADGNANYRRINNDFILTANKKLNDFDVRALVGHNVRMDDKKTTSIGASNLLYSEVFNPGSRTGELNGNVALTQYRSMAVYGEVSAAYKNYLYLTLTGRNDWVSVLSPENRSFFYPGVSTSFVFTDAFPQLQSNVLSFGKLFASWNKTGNVTLSPYQLNNSYSQTNGFPFGNVIGFVPSSTNPNPNIEPEFVTSYEVGVQVGMLNERVNLEASYVFSDSEGQIFNATTSRATGYSTARVNAGRLTNSIIELNLNGDLISKSNLTWNMGFTFAYINNQVKELYEGLTSINNFRQSYSVIGEAYPTLQVSDYQRDPQGRVVVDATTGDPIVATEMTTLGTLVPPYQMGVSTSIRYKGFNIGAQFDWRMGGWLYSEIIPRMYTAGTHPATAAYDRQPFVWPNSVIETSPGVYVANDGLTTSSGGRAFWTRQGEVQINTAAKSDFFKLRELNISYTIPVSALSWQNVVRQASIGFVGTNLFIIRHVDNTMGDPEYLYNNTDGYLSFRQVPPYRTYGFTLNVTL